MRQQQTTAERISRYQQRKTAALARLAATGWLPVLEDFQAMTDDPTAIHGRYWYRVRHPCGHTLKWNQWHWQRRHEEHCEHRPCSVF